MNCLRMRNYVLATAATAALLTAQPAIAEIITVEYEADITNLNESPWPEGVAVRGTYTYDFMATCTQVGGPGIDYCEYPTLSHTIELTLPPEVASINAPISRVYVVDNSPSGSGHYDHFAMTAYDIGLDFSGFQVGHMELYLGKTTPIPNNTFTDASLPLSNEDLAGFEIPPVTKNLSSDLLRRCWPHPSKLVRRWTFNIVSHRRR